MPGSGSGAGSARRAAKHESAPQESQQQTFWKAEKTLRLLARSEVCKSRASEADRGRASSTFNWHERASVLHHERRESWDRGASDQVLRLHSGEMESNCGQQDPCLDTECGPSAIYGGFDLPLALGVECEGLAEVETGWPAKVREGWSQFERAQRFDIALNIYEISCQKL
jgi:hypothetical protein